MRIFPVAALCGAVLAAAEGGVPSLPDARPNTHLDLGGLGEPTLLLAAASGARTSGGWLDDPGPTRGGTRGGTRKSQGSPANRTAYLAYQTALSTYVYGIGVPIALGFDSPRALIATPLIMAPLAFGAHLSTTSRLDFTDAHVKASFYAPTAATYAATALSLAFTPDAGTGYRVGSLIGAAAYPAGLWYGWKLGDAYRSNPNQLDNKMFFALGYGFLGLVTPILYFERPSRHSEDILRIGLGQSVGMAAAGHFISDYYRPRGVSSGVPMGVATHAALGGLGGIAVAAYSDASASVRPWLGAGVIGATLGFSEGVYFFKDRRDSKERSQYAALGAAGGAMMGLGLQILTYNEDYNAYGNKVTWASFLVGGALVGYVATYALTPHLTESASREPRRDGAEASEPLRWTFNPMPVPEYVMSRGEPASRWKIPGVTYRF